MKLLLLPLHKFSVALGLATLGLTLSAQTASTWQGTTTAFGTTANWSNGSPSRNGSVYGVFDGQGLSNVTGAYVNSSLQFDSGSYDVNFANEGQKGAAAFNYIVNAGTQTFNGVEIGLLVGTGTWNIANGATLNVNNQIGRGPHSMIVNGTLNFNGAVTAGPFTKSGSGVLTLGAVTHTFGGSMAVNGGDLIVNGTVSSTGSTFTVNSGGRLGGTGTINKATTINSGGTLAPARARAC